MYHSGGKLQGECKVRIEPAGEGEGDATPKEN